MWKERDTSVEHAEWLKAEVRPVEHKEAQPYAVMRDAIIRGSGAPLTDAVRAKLVAATAGLTRPEIEQAAADCAERGAFPTRPEFSWCRNPETGEYAERLLDPFEMRDMLAARGFKVQLRHAFRKFPHRLMNGVAFRPLNERLFDMRAQFVLVAEKAGQSGGAA
jgi:hypothetical protein